MRKGHLYWGLIGILLAFFLGVSELYADECPQGFIDGFMPGKDNPSTKKIPLCKDTLHYQAMLDGEVVGEITFRMDEADVLIEIEGEPLTRNQDRGMSLLGAAAQLERVRSQVKDEVIRLDNAARVARNLPEKGVGEAIRREYHHVFHGLAARVKREAVKDIEAIPGVRKVWPDRKVQATLGDSVPLIRADRVWAEMGVTGRGIVVAIVDTGIDYTHPDLGGCLGPQCKVIGGYDFINQDPNPLDDNGHGTHVAGIVAANGSIKGVAPDARLMAFKVLDQNGSGSFSSVLAGIEKAVDPDGNPSTDDGANVINLSLGGGGDPNDPLCQAVDNAFRSGVVVVVAAGNAGSGYDTIGSPGSARLALTVGAADKTDHIASFSSRGPAPVTFQIKPEITAPGVGILSTVPQGSCDLCHPSGYRVLSGTSMATPHVAGAAALLLERFPAFTPLMVKEALMARALDLGLNAFTQGNGRMDVWGSAALSAMASPAILSLGLDPLNSPVFQIWQNLTLTNWTSVPQNYSLSMQGNFPNGMTASVSPSRLTLGPGQMQTFMFSCSVDNGLVPNPTDPTHSYGGTILIAGGGETLRLPFAVIKSPSLEIVFDEEPLILAVHNRSNLVNWIPEPGKSRTLLLPVGTYDVISIFSDPASRIVREGIPLTNRMHVDVSKKEASHPFTIIPMDKNGQPLALSRYNIMVSYFKHKTARFMDATFYWGGAPSFYFSNVSGSYSFEVSLLEQPNRLKGPTYTFLGHARDGIQGPKTFQNRPEDFRRVIFRHAVDPGVTRIAPSQTLGSPTQYMAIHVSTDVPLDPPFEEEAYYIPAPYPEFALGFVRKEIYSVPAGGSGSPESELITMTPFLRARDKSILEGYLTDLNVGEAAGYRSLVLSTDAERLSFGMGPYGWNGRFANAPTEITLHGALGSSAWFFLGQLLDVRPHDPLMYELYKGTTLFRSGSLPGAGNPFSAPMEASIPVPAGVYTLKVPFGNYFISGKQGSALMEATFDTARSDPNPPYLTQFNTMENGAATDTIGSGNGQVVFKVMDEGSLKQVGLSYDAGNGWQDFALSSMGGNQYRTNIPTFPKDTFVSLKLVTEDTQGNRLAYEMKPAILVKAAAPGDKPVFAVNCGGAQYVDKAGVVYQGDTLFAGGGTYRATAPIAATEDDLLYQSERFGNFAYNIPLPNGNYTVTLKFAEIYYSSAGRRVFDVKMEGKEVISNLDIVAKVGKNKAYDVTIPVSVTDGVLKIESKADTDSAKIGAIVVNRAGAPAQLLITATAGAGGTISPQGAVAVSSGATQAFIMTPNAGFHVLDVKVDGASKGPLPSYIFANVTSSHTIEATFAADPQGGQIVFAANCGGPQYTDTSGVVYQADTQFSGGGTYQTAASIADTTDAVLYRSERFGNFAYNIPLPNGNYQVTLKFAEIYNSGAGTRVFDVKMEGKEVISNLDIYAKVRKNKAYDVTLPVSVMDGVLNIEFKPDVGNAKVSAILVVSQ